MAPRASVAVNSKAAVELDLLRRDQPRRQRSPCPAPSDHPAGNVCGGYGATSSNGHERRTGRNAKSPRLTAGLIVDADGNKLIATHATKAGKRYRYYISKALHDGRKRGRLGRLGRDHVMHLETNGTEV